MADKEFQPIERQVEILKERGLHIDNPEFAKDFLLRNNYYRVSGYSLTLRNHDVFYKNASFQNIVDIYLFDHDLRHILLHYLEHIEVTIKSVYSYEFTKLYGATGYLDEKRFSDVRRHKEIMQKCNEQKDKRHAHEAYIKHFMDDLHQELPLWAYVDLMTIYDISIIYQISEQSLKKTVASHFGLTMNSADKLLGQFMHSMTIIRNLCAHGSRLFNRLFEQKPSLNKAEQGLLIENEDGTKDNAHLYGFILIMRRLLNKEDFSALKGDIIKLTTKYPFVSMKYYGFRNDWKQKL